MKLSNPNLSLEDEIKTEGVSNVMLKLMATSVLSRSIELTRHSKSALGNGLESLVGTSPQPDEQSPKDKEVDGPTDSGR